jgi:hypothetical protein
MQGNTDNTTAVQVRSDGYHEDAPRSGYAAALFPDWRDLAKGALALAGITLVMVLLYAHPAHAQDLNTCSDGGGVGGDGGQKILTALKNIVMFVAATIGSLTVLGMLSSGAMVAAGSVSKDWQRRGMAGLGYSAIGGGVALASVFAYGVLNWAVCG